MINNRDVKGKIKRPGVGYILLGFLLWFYAIAVKKHKLISKLKEKLKPPFIVIGNHTSFYDFVYALRAVYPVRVNFVVARKYFHFRGLSWVMKRAKAIPKSLYQSDTGTVKDMLSVIKQGGAVGLFPEGQISIDGITLENGDAIAKLVKKAGVPVVRILTSGAYFCNPPWSGNTRKGPVKSEIEVILTEKEVKSLSADLIMDRINQSIYLDSYACQKSSGTLYSGKNLASGLEYVLYICPCCESEFTIDTEADAIICSHCGTEAIYGTDGHLSWKKESHFNHLGQWHRWQLNKERAAINGGAYFSVTEPVELAMLKQKGKGVQVVGKGTFTADKENYTYEGTLNGETVSLKFPTANTRYLPFDTGKNFQIYKNNLLYEFRPANTKWCMKIANICEILYSLQNMKVPE